MSFAPTKKDPNKKNNQNQAKSSMPIQQEESSTDSTKNRVTLLEEIVSKLQEQQESFEPLLELLTRASEVSTLEDKANELLKSASDLEEKIESQSKTAREIEKRTKEITIPSSISEGQGMQAKSLPVLLSNVGEIENSIQKITTKRKMNARKEEVSNKDVFLKSLNALQDDMAGTTKFIKGQSSAFLKENSSKVTVLEDKAVTLRDRQKTDQSLIEESLCKRGAAQDAAASEGWLHQELSSRVHQGLEDLTKHLNYKYHQLELTFKQNLLSLKTTYTQVLSGQYTYNTIKKKTQDSGQGKIDGVANIDGRLERISTVHFVHIKDITNAINETLNTLIEKSRNFLGTLTVAIPEEKQMLLSIRKVEFFEWLESIRTNITSLEETLSRVSDNIDSDMVKMFNTVEQLQSQNPQKHAELSAKTNTLRSTFTKRFETLTNEVTALRNKLFGLWKSLIKETTLEVPFQEKTPEDAAAFEAAALVSLA